MRKPFLLITLICLISGCDFTPDFSDTYVFEGEVVDDNTSEPVADVRVEVALYTTGQVCEITSGKPCGSGYDKIVAEEQTNESGKFELKHEDSITSSDKYRIRFFPCHSGDQSEECMYEQAAFDVESSWEGKTVRLQQK